RVLGVEDEVVVGGVVAGKDRAVVADLVGAAAGGVEVVEALAAVGVVGLPGAVGGLEEQVGVAGIVADDEEDVAGAAGVLADQPGEVDATGGAGGDGPAGADGPVAA